MINLDFMPSRQLALYAARLFLTRSLAVMVMLVLVLMTLDLLGESGKILKVPGNGEAELWRYVSLRVPMLISRFLPFSVLLGALIAFVGLNQHSEVVSMKAAGLSAHQILAPMVVASLGVAIALFAFNELVVVKAARTVNAWTDADYKPIPPIERHPVERMDPRRRRSGPSKDRHRPRRAKPGCRTSPSISANAERWRG